MLLYIKSDKGFLISSYLQFFCFVVFGLGWLVGWLVGWCFVGWLVFRWFVCVWLVGIQLGWLVGVSLVGVHQNKIKYEDLVKDKWISSAVKTKFSSCKPF